VKVKKIAPSWPEQNQRKRVFALLRDFKKLPLGDAPRRMQSRLMRMKALVKKSTKEHESASPKAGKGPKASKAAKPSKISSKRMDPDSSARVAQATLYQPHRVANGDANSHANDHANSHANGHANSHANCDLGSCGDNDAGIRHGASDIMQF